MAESSSEVDNTHIQQHQDYKKWLQQKLISLSEEHVLKQAEHRASILAARHELELLSKPDLRLVNSSIVQPMRNSDDGQYYTENNLSASVESSDYDSINNSNNAIRQARVDSILAKVMDQNELILREKDIERLRNRDEEAKLYDSSDISRELSNLRRSKTSAAGDLISSDGKIDRNLAVHEFLDQWLNEDIKKPLESRSRPVSGQNISSGQGSGKYSLRNESKSNLESIDLLSVSKAAVATLKDVKIREEISVGDNQKRSSNSKIPSRDLERNNEQLVDNRKLLTPSTKDSAVNRIKTSYIDNQISREELSSIAPSSPQLLQPQVGQSPNPQFMQPRQPYISQHHNGQPYSVYNQQPQYGQPYSMQPQQPQQHQFLQPQNPQFPSGLPYMMQPQPLQQQYHTGQSYLMQPHVPYQNMIQHQPQMAPYAMNQPQLMSPYMIQPHSSFMHGSQQPATGPGALYQFPSIPYNTPSMDPVQNNMLQQFQKMADQIEQENIRLLTQLSGNDRQQKDTMQEESGPGKGAPIQSLPSRGNDKYHSLPAQDAAANNDGLRNKDKESPFIYRLERDNLPRKRNEEVAKLSKEEIVRQEEIRLIQHDLDKLKNQKELEDFKAEYERFKLARKKQNDYELWLEDQKRELQMLKMQQILAKEKRLLDLQVKQPDDLIPLPSISKPVAAYNNAPNLGSIKDQCGVGRSLIPVELSKGVAVLVDGLLIPAFYQDGMLFRVALGIYDKDGKSLVRLTASEWQIWKKDKANSIVLIDKTVVRNLKSTEVPKPNTFKSKALIELQVKDKDSSPQRTAGWGIVSIGSQERSDDSGSRECLGNGCWRVCIRSGISDPVMDPFEKFSGTTLSECFFLIRVIDAANLIEATSWELTSTGLDAKGLGALYEEPVLVDAPPPLSLSLSNSVSALSRGSSRMNNPTALSRGASNMNLLGEGITGKYSAPSTPNKAPGSRLETLRESPSFRGIPPSSAPIAPVMGGGLLDRVQEADLEDSPRPIPRHIDGKSHWYLGDPLGPCTERYQRGDGIDIYIDAGRYFPDNCTITRVSMRIFASTKEQIGSVFEGYCDMSGSARSPIFKLKSECRGNSINATATALIRVDTIDSSTMLPASIGYACFKLFATRERSQPVEANDPNVFVNTGMFQIPLFAGRLSPATTNFDENMLSGLIRIPCASLLVRIYAAPKSVDGISTLSRSEYPADEWERLRLNIPPPDYASGAYCGVLCEPTPMELLAFEAKDATPSVSAESAILQGMEAMQNSNLPEAPSVSEQQKRQQWWQSLLPPIDSIRRIIDYTLAIPYSVESGISISILSLFNMSEGLGNSGIFTSDSSVSVYKVIYSISPPGLYYKNPPLYDEVHWTKTHDLEKAIKAPEFNDGFVMLNPAELGLNVYLVLDVRTVSVEPPKAPSKEPVIGVQPPNIRRSFWTILPLSREKCVGQGYRYALSGYFQLPLIEGSVVPDILSSANPHRELCSRLSSKKSGAAAGAGKETLKMSEGMSIMVQVMNPLLRDLILPTMTAPDAAPDSTYLTSLIDAAREGVSGPSLKAEKFAYNASTYSVTNNKTIKTLARGMQTQKGQVTPPAEILSLVNKAFQSAANLSSQ